MSAVQLRKRFTGQRQSSGFLLDVEFDVQPGTTVLFGPSGSGKTLTLDCIAGLSKPDAGRIELNGAVLFDSAARLWTPPQQRRCGYVFQNYALFPHMTIWDNLTFTGQAAKAPEMIRRFRLDGLERRYPHQLSGGQQQRCTIARALLTEPQLLLLDEPARGLDAPLRIELYGTIRQVQREFGTPVLLVTHDVEECREIGDMMHVYEHGHIVQSGPPADVLAHPATAGLARLFGI